ncbi:MAG TPA: nitrile hydratase subunit beta [Usitatibacter sp.]|nr:nitrile hydratase subunit beta [Usitatibacter sp.]
MNTVHDMGGMQNFGPVVPEADEPAFHHKWERRAFGMTLAMAGARLWTLDQSRFARESIPPALYLASSYYKIWMEGLCRLMLERGLVTTEELADGRARASVGVKIPNVLTADRVASALARGSPTLRPNASAARFAVGDAVRTKNVHPRSHTRLPRYCRDKPGAIAKVHGVHVFADASALGHGEESQWLYCVRFDARDLWGPDTTAAAVFVDCWEPYLCPPLASGGSYGERA